MPAPQFPRRPLAVAVALAVVHLGAAAQDAKPAEPDKTDGLGLDQIVVTGTSGGTAKMKTSVSISTLDGDVIANSNAVSAAEVLRQIPGLRSESSGGESNANVGVRGIPISAGGARYLQFQEDGLPVLMFGDIAFATPDTWLRADGSLDRLEVVRGGSASTLTTGSPGGLINFISKTGLDEGGFMSLTKGLDFSQTRQEFGYGGKLADKTRFYIGGFYRVGDGGRPGAAETENGGQVRINVTRDLGKGSYVRFSFKHLDDRTPTFMPTPVRYVGDRIETIPGLDPRRAAFYNAGWPMDNTLTSSNGRETSNIRDGLSARSDVFGAEFDLDAGAGVRLTNKFRWSKNSGRFIGIFPGDDVADAPAGTTVASGANAGAAYSGSKFTAVVFNTRVDDAGLMANDTRLSKTLALGDSRLTLNGGLFTSVQDLKLTWNFNQYSLSASESGAQLLNVPGVVNGSPGFGGCCMNYQDSKYRTTAPYAIVGWETGRLNLDASVRQDRNHASGLYQQTIGPGGTAGVAYDLSQPQVIDYGFQRTNYSLGANFALQKDLSLFARYSDGAAYLADRITFFNNPGLVNGTSPTVPVNEVKQLEGGAKWRAGGVSLFATLFLAKTDEVNVDLTTTPIRVTRTKYASKGLELEGAYRAGGFALNGGLTYTDAEVDESTNGAIVGKTPKRQAKVVYQFAPSYTLDESLQFGATVIGTTGSKDDGPAGPLTITLPAYYTVNAFVNYQLTPSVTLALGANNLFDKLAYTESNDGRGAARALNGRTVKTTLKYTF